MGFTVIVKATDAPVSVSSYEPFEQRDAAGAITERGSRHHEVFVPAGCEHAVFCNEGDSVTVQSAEKGATGLRDFSNGVVGTAA